MSKQIERFLALTERMQASSDGIGIEDIQEMFGISRRSAERLRDEVITYFHSSYIEISEGKYRRWKLKPTVTRHLTTIRPDELSVLQSAVDLFKKNNMPEQAEKLDFLNTKILSLIDPKQARRISTDLDALLVAEGYAHSPGPKPKTSIETVQKLREAILANLEIKISYEKRSSGALVKHQLQPYGFLYGNRHYLIAFNPDQQVKAYRMYILSNIKSLEITNQYFHRDESFNIKEYTENSFGVFQEEPFNVVWHFSSAVASDASEFEFHPSQELDWQKDGSLIVRFRAGGRKEMDWYLYRWGDSVTDLTEYPD